MSKNHNMPEDKPAVSSADSKKYFARNTITSIVFSIFNAITSFLMVPYQIKYLGMANLGMITLANSFLSYIQVLTIAFTGTISRFVTLEAATGEYDKAQQYFTTQLVTLLRLTASLMPILACVSFFAPLLLVIPSGEEHNTQLLFMMVFSAFLIMLFSSAFQVSTFIKQRFDIRNMLEILNQVLRYSTWIIMFNLFVPSMVHIGMGYLLGSTAALVGSIITFRKLTPQLKAELSGFDIRKFREMIGMGWWMSVNQLGTLLYLSVDLLVINRMMGPVYVGKYSTILGLSMQMRTLASLLSSMVTPISVAYFARKDFAGLHRSSARAVTFMSLGTAIPLAVLCGLASPFIHIWLGPKYGALDLLMWLMLAHLVINLGVMPLFGITFAANKMKVQGVVTIIGGFVKLGLVIAAIRCTNWGIYGVAVAGLVTLTAKNFIFTPVYTAGIMRMSCWPMYRAMLPGIAVFALTSFVGWKIASICNLLSLPKLAIAGLLLGLLAVAISWLTITKDDKRFLAEAVLRRKVK